MQTRRISILLSLMVITILVIGCGPSAEQSATMTASAWTPTPTPVPYDLSFTVTDQDGNTLSGASVEINGETQISDESGKTVWKDLSGGSAAISINAPGYFSADLTETLDRGENQLAAVLDLDPNGLLPVNACTPGESMLYTDDFQDGFAQEWDSIEGGTPGWSVKPDPENPGILVVAARAGVTMTFLGGRETYNYDNVVWRMRFKQTGNGSMHVNFRFVEGESLVRRYVLAFDQKANLGRWNPNNQIGMVGPAGAPARDQWHYLEFSYFDGTVSVYMDGKESATWTDPDPWEGGTINLEPYPEADAVFYYDDFSVCKLSAPFEPIPRPKTGTNLSVLLKDADGNPIPLASVTVLEMGELDEASLVTDDAGTGSWSDLPGDAVTLQISAPGYFSKEEQVSLEKGDNQASFDLARDEYGKLSSEICRAEESLLYSEDIQDGAMQGWNSLTNKLELNAPGWALIKEPEQEGNLVLAVQGQADNTHTDQVGYEKAAFGDAVLRFDAKGFSDLHYIVRWHAANNGDGYYAFIYGGNNTGGRMEKMASVNFTQILNWNKYVGDNKWHTYEFSTYQGEYQIWIDGYLMGKWTDPQYFEEGYFTIEHDFWKGDAFAYYDNFSVCQLDAPFASIFADN